MVDKTTNLLLMCVLISSKTFIVDMVVVANGIAYPVVSRIKNKIKISS